MPNTDKKIREVRATDHTLDVIEEALRRAARRDPDAAARREFSEVRAIVQAWREHP